MKSRAAFGSASGSPTPIYIFQSHSRPELIFLRDLDMSKVIDVSGKLGEYMLRGWVCSYPWNFLLQLCSPSHPGLDRQTMLDFWVQCASDAFAHGPNTYHPFLRQL